MIAISSAICCAAVDELNLKLEEIATACHPETEK